MELHQLRYFVAAAETGSISRAASRCGIAQPSLSQQIKKLEQSVGAPLFDRVGRGVVLTDAGRALLPRARRILAAVEEAESNLLSEVQEGVGRLSVGAIPTMAPYLLPPLLSQLRAERPQCELVVREDLTENLIEAVVENALDVAILSTPIDDDRVEVQVIGQEELLVVASAEHPIGGAGVIALADLREQPTVTLHEMHCLGRQISGFCASRQLARNVVCRTTQLATVLELVRLGLGVSIVPDMVARTDAHKGRVYLKLKRQPPTREIALAWRSGRSRSMLSLRLTELLQERMRRDTSLRA